MERNLLLREVQSLSLHEQGLIRDNETYLAAGTKSTAAAMSWKELVATGDNPYKRIYYVTTGSLGKGGPCKLRLSVYNRNDHYNLQSVFFKVRLKAQFNGIEEKTIQLEGQTPAESKDQPPVKPKHFKTVVFPKREIADNDTENFDFIIAQDTLLKAYSLDKNNEKTFFEAQIYWREGNITTDRFWNGKTFMFFLVNPIETLDQNVVIKEEIDEKLKTAIFEKKYNGNEGNIVVSLKTGIVKTDSRADSITSSVSTTNTQGTEKSREDEVSLSLNLGTKEDFITGGGGYKVKTGEKFSTSVSSQITNSVMGSDTFTKSASQEYSITETIKPAPKGHIKKIFLIPVFEKRLLTVINYENIDEFGMAGSRRITRDVEYRVFKRWRHEIRVISPLKKIHKHKRK